MTRPSEGISPEEIRHLSLGRRVRGYDCDEVDRVLTVIADSFEAVWRDRTSLYEEVRRLQEELLRAHATIADLRSDSVQTRADRDKSALKDFAGFLRDALKQMELLSSNGLEVAANYSRLELEQQKGSQYRGRDPGSPALDDEQFDAFEVSQHPTLGPEDQLPGEPRRA